MGKMALLAGGFLIALAILRLNPWIAAPSNSPVHLAFARVVGTILSNIGRLAIAISPDGTQIVFVSNGQLYRRSLGASDASPVLGTQNLAPTTPTFSPDADGWRLRSNLRSATAGAAETQPRKAVLALPRPSR
jgi:hypothetical protein